MSAPFVYEEAFSRNIGWFTIREQQQLRGKRVAIAGMGGVGGVHLMTLTRMGIGAFTIADFDCFEVANFNRQMGAKLSSVGQPKAATMAAMARDVNPELDLKIFDQGLTEENIDAFLKDVDVYVDGLDFFVLPLRRKIFERCRALGIPSVTVAPLGMGAAALIFMPDTMSFEDYFRFDGLSEEQQFVHFAMGVSPKGLNRAYLVDPLRMDLVNRRGPSLGLSCELCAGFAAAQVAKILLKRGPILAAPHYQTFDAYLGVWKQGVLRGGNANPWQRIKLKIGYRHFQKLAADTIPAEPTYTNEIEAILNIARWAPTAENRQQWRFQILEEERVQIRLLPAASKEEDILDIKNGRATLLSGGMLLESMRLAAASFGRSLAWTVTREANGSYVILADLKKNAPQVRDPLLPFIPERSVDRRSYRLTALTEAQKNALQDSLGDTLKVQWHESFRERRIAAQFNAIAINIRLQFRYAIESLQKLLDWDHRFSLYGVPGHAIGASPLSVRILRWLFKDWRRVSIANKYLGVVASQLELEILPGLLCAAHFTFLLPDGHDETPETYLRTGSAIQRFWLTATSLGLAIQPGYAALVFGTFGRDQTPFTNEKGLLKKAAEIADAMERFDNTQMRHIAFRGRIGTPKGRILSRSIRKPLEALREPAAKS